MDARKEALNILNRIESSGQYSNIALDVYLDRQSKMQNGLNDKDKALVSIIVLGVLERRLTLDYYIDKLAKHPNEIDDVTRNVLRMGMYQLAFLSRVPSYAAVSETVEIAPHRTKGFVNAMLRRFLGNDCAIEIEGDCDSVRHLSIEYSIPERLCEKFLSKFGVERSKKIFEIFNSAPPDILRINTLKISRKDYETLLENEGIEYEIKGTEAISVRGTAIPKLPGFSEGYFFVQDMASQYCVKALGLKPGDVFVDTCCCPGAKTFGAAIEMRNAGEVHSFDLHKNKLSLVESGASRLGIRIVETEPRDGRCPDESLFGQADVVLCDAPCSGFGIISKKPEIRYKNLDECEKLPQIQFDILDKTAAYVKSGGTLVYSTCTMFDDENSDVVNKFLSYHHEFSLCPFELEGVSCDTKSGMASLTPDMDGCDGFFIAKMIKE